MDCWKSKCVQAEHLRQHYMTKYNAEVSDAQQALRPVLHKVSELKRKVGRLYIATRQIWAKLECY